MANIGIISQNINIAQWNIFGQFLSNLNNFFFTKLKKLNYEFKWPFKMFHCGMIRKIWAQPGFD